MSEMKWYDWTAIALLVAGGLNWGVIGVFNYNVVQAVAGSWSWLIYVLVGIAAIFAPIRLALND